MRIHYYHLIAAAALASAGIAGAADPGPNDSQIAHIAYTAGQIDVVAARQALAKSQNRAVRDFASLMIRDHDAVNNKALELVHRLGVTPEPNATSTALETAAKTALKDDASLSGAAYDRAYVKNEVAFHRTVNTALHDTLIPSAKNAELKGLLETGLTLFTEHQAHAEMLEKSLK